MPLTTPIFAWPIHSRFIVQGVQWGYCPGSWEEVEGATVKQEIKEMMYGRNNVLTYVPADYLGENVNRRKVFQQQWMATWDAEAWMAPEMYDFFHSLATTETHFWLQYDDVMSREPTFCLNPEGQLVTYFTPTCPIMPYGWSPDFSAFNATSSYNTTVYKNGTPMSGGFSVDQERGCITFSPPLLSSDVVTMQYSWRAYCRIMSMELYPMGVLSKTFYIGKVVFQQVAPNYSDLIWNQRVPNYLQINHPAGLAN
jgi:hypothetical protein